MNKIIKFILIFELILLTIFIIGYFIYESKQPKQVISTCGSYNVTDNFEINFSNLEILRPIIRNSTIRENLNT
jgi:hypothetical protein